MAVTNAQAQMVRSSVDTTLLNANALAVFHLWSDYLAWKNGDFHGRATESTEYWLAAEQKRWPVYDLAMFYLNDNSAAEILSISPEPNATDSVYQVTTLFRSGNPGDTLQSWWNEVRMTVYAARENGEWRLSNALSRSVRNWSGDTVGPITYVYPPGYNYSRTRALGALAFSDSVAQLFDVPRLAPLTYYLANTSDEVMEIMGLVSRMKYGPVGGLSQPVNHQLFSGSPKIGEVYRHELAHIILRPLVTDATPYFFSEGIPTWIGGTNGKDFKTAVQSLNLYLNGHPQITLDSLFQTSFEIREQWYVASAVMVDMVFHQGGMLAVKQLFAARGAGLEMRADLSKLLHRTWERVTTDWRAQVRTVALNHRSPR